MPSSTRPVLHFPFPTPVAYQPPAEYELLRSDDPVARVQLPTGDTAWLVSGWADVRQVLTDPRFSRAAASHPDAPRLRPLPPDRSTILAFDPPEHGRLRRLVQPAFSARRIGLLAPRITTLVAGLLDKLEAAGPPADLLPGLALPMPVTVICYLLGLPTADQLQFRDWADTMMTLSGHSREQVQQAREAMNSYLAELVADKRRNPSDDLMGDLVRARDDGDRLTEQELVIFGVTLLIAGYHTTSTALLNAVLLLLDEPALFRRLAGEPKLLTRTVEELLRLSSASSSGGNLRVAVADVQLSGVLIRAGEAVLPAIVSANRDPAVFDEAEQLDAERAGNPHLAFGYGAHYCLGAALARLELNLALAALSARLPALSLAVPRAQLRWDESAVIRRVEALPVSW